MGPQLMSIVPNSLQGLAQPAAGVSADLCRAWGSFQSLLSPFMSMASNPSLMGGTLGSLGAAEAAPLMTAAGIGGGGFGSLAAGLGGGGIGGSAVRDSARFPRAWAGWAASAVYPCRPAGRRARKPAERARC